MDLFWKYHEELQEVQRERNALRSKNDQLKQQLAEKEAEFKWLHQKFAKYVENNQDKISFAVEQLEKVKEKIKGYEKIYIDNQIKQLKEGE